MGRIRSVKPEVFLDEQLWDAAEDSGLPVHWAFVGLWCQADREGRFEWRPRRLKAAILPYWDGDFSRVLDALTTRGFVVRYASNGREFGHVRTFRKHQVVNNREAASTFPPPPAEGEGEVMVSATSTRGAHVPHACPTPLVRAPVEGKGREGKGGEDDVVVLRGREADDDDDPAAALPGQDPVKKPGHVTGIDACRVYCETIGQTYAYGANARSFDAIAAAANDHAPDAERALRDATRHHRIWATGDGKGRAGPGHLARGFHRDLAEARGTLAPKRGPARPSSEDDFEEVTPAWLEGGS